MPAICSDFLALAPDHNSPLVYTSSPCADQPCCAEQEKMQVASLVPVPLRLFHSKERLDIYIHRARLPLAYSFLGNSQNIFRAIKKLKRLSEPCLAPQAKG